jgi:hypothetical protein
LVFTALYFLSRTAVRLYIVFLFIFCAYLRNLREMLAVGFYWAVLLKPYCRAALHSFFVYFLRLSAKSAGNVGGWFLLG